MNNFDENVVFNQIPVVDCNGDVLKSGKKIFQAVATVGFVYLKNFGIKADEVSQVFDVAQKFFNLPDEQKHFFDRSKNYKQDGNSGYVAPNVEILNPKSSTEIREAFNFRRIDIFKNSVDPFVDNFHSSMDTLSRRCFELAMQILRIFAEHLHLEDKEFFNKCHHESKSATTLRLLHYPPLSGNIGPDAVKCGEHSDYGSITLLFQDNVGGLEVLGRDGRFIPATPVPDTVLVNTGDLLQRWTSDRIIAVRHRVLVPEDKRLWSSERYSLAYFVHPDDDVIVKPLDGSNKYEPVGSGDYLLQKFSKTY